MKKSLLVLAIASTLAACGGGGGGSPTVPSQVFPIHHGEVYFNDQGGKIDIAFTPKQILPNWIKNKDGQFFVDPAECENRNFELSGDMGSATIIQTSKKICDLPDYANEFNIFKYYNRLETAVDSKLRMFSSMNIDSRFSTVNSNDWPKKRGTNQVMIQVNKNDCLEYDCTRVDPRERSEVAFNIEDAGSSSVPKPNKEYWVKLSFYVPIPYTEQGAQFGTNQELTIFQILTTTLNSSGVRTYDPFLMVGKKLRGDFTSTTWVNSNIPLERHIISLIQDNNFEGHWHDLMLMFRGAVNDSKEPTLEIYVNGIKKFSYYQRTMLDPTTEVYMKFGLYRPKSNTNPEVQQIYFDEIRFGNSRAEVEAK